MRKPQLIRISDSYAMSSGDEVFDTVAQVSDTGRAHIQVEGASLDQDDAYVYVLASLKRDSGYSALTDSSGDVVKKTLDEDNNGLLLTDLQPGSWIKVGIDAGTVTSGTIVVNALV